MTWKPKYRFVSAGLVKAAAERADLMMANDPELREAWLDQVQTSKASDNAGGIVRLDQPSDWVLAFYAWREGADIPRER